MYCKLDMIRNGLRAQEYAQPVMYSAAANWQSVELNEVYTA
jgi:hypothetical protein